jgi:hypothetical protein
MDFVKKHAIWICTLIIVGVVIYFSTKKTDEKAAETSAA